MWHQFNSVWYLNQTLWFRICMLVPSNHSTCKNIIHQNLNCFKISSSMIKTCRKHYFPVLLFIEPQEPSLHKKWSFLRIWSHLLKKSLTENFVFYAVLEMQHKWTTILSTVFAKVFVLLLAIQKRKSLYSRRCLYSIVNFCLRWFTSAYNYTPDF